MDEDPCELVNVGDQYSEIREEMIAKLDEYEQNSVTPLIDESDKLDLDDYSPDIHCDDGFWCPFMEYEEVPFEDVLAADYIQLFGDSAESVVVQNSNVFADWNILGIDVDRGRGEWRIAFVLCLLIVMSVICLLHINGMYASTRQRQETESKVRRETAPLM